MSFDKDGEKIIVTVNVDDKKTMELKYPSSKLENYKYVFVQGTESNPVTVASIKLSDSQPEVVKGPYTEYSFNSFGIKDGTYTEFVPKEMELESLDKVKFTGKITFKEANGTPGFGICTVNSELGIKFVCADGNIYVQDFTGENQGGYMTYSELGYASPDELLNKEHTISMSFDKDGEKIIVTVNVDDIKTMELKYLSSKLENYKYVFVQGTEANPVTVASITESVKPENPASTNEKYQEYTFYNLGLANGKYQDSKCVDWNVKSYDKVAFTGQIKFTKSNLDAGIVFAPNAGDWSGLNIGIQGETVYFQNYLKTGEVSFKFSDLGYKTAEEFYDSYLKIRLMFNKYKGKIRMTIVLNDTETAHIDFTEKQLKTLNSFVVRASEDKPVIIKSVYLGDNKEPKVQPQVKKPKIYDSPRKDLSNYSDFTFSTMHIENGIVKNEAKSGTVNSLDGKVFKGKITFPGEGKGSITVGGNEENRWFGIHIESVDGGLIFYEAANGEQKWRISKDTIGKDITNKKIELYLTFDCIDDANVYVGVYVNGKFCGERLYCDLQEPFGGAVLVYSESVGIKIASVATTWQKFLMSDVDLSYFGFSNKNWKSELLQRCQ